MSRPGRSRFNHLLRHSSDSVAATTRVQTACSECLLLEKAPPCAHAAQAEITAAADPVIIPASSWPSHNNDVGR